MASSISRSRQQWAGPRAAALDEVEAAHRGIGGTGRGRRYATEQINRAYAVLLSSQWQGYCRDLHTECTGFLVRHPAAAKFRLILTPALTQGRKLDKGNPNPGNIGSDFNRFGLSFWLAVQHADGRSVPWQHKLEELNNWRNAISHQDFDPAVLGSLTLRIERVRVWRRACNGLANAFEAVMRNHLFSLLNSHPW